MENNYWIRICFEKKFETPTDANDFVEDLCKDVNSQINNLCIDIEER